ARSFEPLRQRVDRRFGQHQRVATHDVVDIDALHRQDVDADEVAGSLLKVSIDGGAVDDEGISEAKLAELRGKRLRLRLLGRRLIENDQLLAFHLVGKGELQRESTNLLRQVVS